MKRYRLFPRRESPTGGWVRYTDAVAAVRAERERCAQIAQKVSDHYTVLYNKARTERALLAGRQYYDGASDAAEEIVEKIEGRHMQ